MKRKGHLVLVQFENGRASAAKAAMENGKVTARPKRLRKKWSRVEEAHLRRESANLFSGTHHDPFDRLLTAPANLEDMILITADRMVERYPVEILWAGR